MDEYERKQFSRREFIKNLLAGSATVQTGVWSALVGAITTATPDSAEAQLLTQSFWKTKVSNVYFWGANQLGALGLGTTSNVTSPRMNYVHQYPSMIGMGNGYMLYLQTNGRLYSSGYNGDGQLGLNNTTSLSKLTQVKLGPGSWSMVASGNSHSIGTDSTGKLWAFGTNWVGELGVGSTSTPVSSPVQLAGTTVWSKIAASSYRSGGITSTGALFTWGANGAGQLGNGNQNNVLSPVQIMTGTSFTQIAMGVDFSTAITAAGALYAWGSAAFNSGYDGTNYGTDFNATPTALRGVTGTFSQVHAVGLGQWSLWADGLYHKFDGITGADRGYLFAPSK
jgi:alpha-tubulin suppressor-like RCC1 family protein